MDYLQNHIWCHSSNWGGIHYDCRHLVSVSKVRDHDLNDWKNLIDEQADSYFDRDAYDSTLYAMTKLSDEDVDLIKKQLPERVFTRYVNNLKPHVLEWLTDNIEDRGSEHGCEKGWCIGSLEYRANDSGMSFTIFFHRKSDAMKFVREFSEWKKPTNYLNYFKDDRKKLNLETLKYEVV